jgi:hypothetical protein
MRLAPADVLRAVLLRTLIRHPRLLRLAARRDRDVLRRRLTERGTSLGVARFERFPRRADGGSAAARTGCPRTAFAALDSRSRIASTPSTSGITVATPNGVADRCHTPAGT